MRKYTHILWDWNGTLLDDVAWCMACINAMLNKRGLPALDTVEAYRAVFGFPVIDYYRRAGFDFEKEPYVNLAAEFIDRYYGYESRPNDSRLAVFPGAAETLSAFREAGVRQILLSASEMNYLLAQVNQFGMAVYFDEILGISDIYAAGKTELGIGYIRREKPEKAVLIGDTPHDLDVARALGVYCILVASGHQSKDALLSAGGACEEAGGTQPAAGKTQIAAGKTQTAVGKVQTFVVVDALSDIYGYIL